MLSWQQMLMLWAPVALALLWLALYLADKEQRARDEAERLRTGVRAHNERMNNLCVRQDACGPQADKTAGCAVCPRRWRVKVRDAYETGRARAAR